MQILEYFFLSRIAPCKDFVPGLCGHTGGIGFVLEPKNGIQSDLKMKGVSVIDSRKTANSVIERLK